MCIRYAGVTEKVKGLKAVVRDPLVGQDDLFTGAEGRILRLTDEGERELVAAGWGLTPHWAKDANWGRRSAFNARSESLAEKPTFREPFKKRRCIVPATALYEQHEGRWLRYLPTQEEFFPVAGLWEPANDLSDRLTYTMVTAPANSLVEPANDRMPVILDLAEIDLWMSNESPHDFLQSLLTTCPSDWMTVEDGGSVRRSKEEAPSLF
ncbi:SOS response-associated peptidase [bacterium]|nr:MAG: SOS response-associated peptidase [bacterium]